MTPANNSVKLPNEALKAILSFMTRKQVETLYTLNRQFANIIQSAPFTVKPLLCINWAHEIKSGKCISFMRSFNTLASSELCHVKRAFQSRYPSQKERMRGTTTLLVQ
jgi:hypothetical protein